MAIIRASDARGPGFKSRFGPCFRKVAPKRGRFAPFSYIFDFFVVFKQFMTTTVAYGFDYMRDK